MTESTRALALRDEDAVALAPVPVQRPRSLVPHPNDLQALVIIARNAPAAAGFAIPKGVNHPAKALAVMLAGYELGIGPMTAMRHIAAVNGRTEPDAQLMMGICLANDSSCEFVWHALDDDRAEVEILRRGTSRGRFSFSLEDAKRSGQYDPDNPKMKPKVDSWRRDGGRNIPVYARDDKGEVVMEPEYSYWAAHTRLALAYNAVRLGMKLACPDLINNVLGAMMAASPLLEAVEMGDAPLEAWEQVPDVEGPGDFVQAQARNVSPEDEGPGWGDPPAQAPGPQQRAAKPSGAGAKTAAVWQQEYEEAIVAFGVDPQRVAAIVGGAKLGDVIRYLAKEGVTMEGLMQRALADPTTGELPDVGEGPY